MRFGVSRGFFFFSKKKKMCVEGKNLKVKKYIHIKLILPFCMSDAA